MKKIICIFLLAFSGSLFAQGTLQFNQVLYLSSVTSNTAEWTVPANKVWKIEAMGAYSSSEMVVYINNAPAFLFAGSYSSGYSYSYYRTADAGPIWLPAGTTLGHSVGSSNRWFSIIEFNVIP